MSEQVDMVNHPPHYNVTERQPITVIHDWGLVIGMDLGNAIKYIARAEHKGQKFFDLQKAEWYLKDVITWLEEQPVTISGVPGSPVGGSQGPPGWGVAKEWNLSSSLSIALCHIALFCNGGKVRDIHSALEHLRVELTCLKEQEATEEKI